MCIRQLVQKTLSCDRTMKALRVVHNLVGILLIALVCGVAWGFYEDAMDRREVSRIDAAQAIVDEKLEAFRRTNGHYPNSLRELEFTNSTVELQLLPDVRKLDYRRTQFGYKLSFTGGRGYYLSTKLAREDEAAR